MKSDLIKILDVLFDRPDTPPDMAAIKNIVVGTNHRISLMAEVVRLLWLCGEMPEEFDKEVCRLYE